MSVKNHLHLINPDGVLIGSDQQPKEEFCPVCAQAITSPEVAKIAAQFTLSHNLDIAQFNSMIGIVALILRMNEGVIRVPKFVAENAMRIKKPPKFTVAESKVNGDLIITDGDTTVDEETEEIAGG